MLLRATRPIDFVNERIGLAMRWLVLVAVLIGSGNATIRYLFSTSSNAWLEAQWYLFSGVFLLCASYTLLRNEHVRIDVISANMSHRNQAWIDVLGGILFLLPMTAMITYLSWPVFFESYQLGEVSTDAGGLIRWPVKLLIPVAFFLLTLQGLSQIIKSAAFLAGIAPDPYPKASHVPIEEDLIKEIQEKAVKK
jgi:TRAP-type mannitol/chloroaromatic compound transport system permease small subunit